MEKPLITVFTPTYNRAHTLPRVFESLKQQTLEDFEWLVIDDGSTDNTEEVVAGFKGKATFPIRYYKQENKHKLLTLFRAVQLANGEYFVAIDSDDACDADALYKMVTFWKQAPANTIFVSVLSKDENGYIIGNQFPKNEFLTTIFDMRYRYKIKGDKWGMTKTEIYKKLPVHLNLFKNKGFIPEGVYQYYFDTLGFHYCINATLRIYLRDMEDENSLANSYYSDKNAFGLAENYKTFLNVYFAKKWRYPEVLLRNLLGYVVYAAKDKRPYLQTISEIEDLTLKTIIAVIYPFRSIFKRKQMAS